MAPQPPRTLAPHVQAALSGVQRKTAAGAPHASRRVPHVQAALQTKPGPASRKLGIVQRSREKNEYSVSKKKRVLHYKFQQSHLRSAQKYITEKDMTYAGVEKFKQRSVGRNTLIFMTSYQVQVFLEQDHTYIGVDPEWTGYDIFESTTQFPAVDISSSGSITFYSAAKFYYSAYYDDTQGCYVVEHMKGVSSGT